MKIVSMNTQKNSRLRIGYLAGTSHCGSTLTACMADMHPDIVSVGEVVPNRKCRRSNSESLACSCGETLANCRLWKEVFCKIKDEGILISFSNWTHAYSYLNPLLHRLLTIYPRGRIRRRFQRSMDQLLPLHKNRIKRIDHGNEAFLDALFSITNAEVLFDTSKGAYRLYRLLKNPNIDVRVIRIVRDVRAFVASKKRRGIPASEAAKIWQHNQVSLNHVCGLFDPERILFIRYEDLATDPAHYMQQIHEHLGLQTAETSLTVDPTQHHVIGNRIRTQGTMQIQLNEKWKTALTEREGTLALSIAGPINRQFGYSD